MAKTTRKDTTARARPQAGTRAKKVLGPFGESQTAVAQLPHEYAAVRAYHIFLSRGAAPGRDLDDWLQAERELLTS